MELQGETAGSDRLHKSRILKNLLKEQNLAGRVYGAICSSPAILHRQGLLKVFKILLSTLLSLISCIGLHVVSAICRIRESLHIHLLQTTWLVKEWMVLKWSLTGRWSRAVDLHLSQILHWLSLANFLAMEGQEVLQKALFLSTPEVREVHGLTPQRSEFPSSLSLY